MQSKKLGEQTYIFSHPLPILSTGSVVGKKEGAGPLGSSFDEIIADPLYGEKVGNWANRRWSGGRWTWL